MYDLKSEIDAACLRIHPILQSNPAELARRLARRNTPTLRRPPRAWCLAIRASDTRINPATAICSPEHAAYPRSHLSSSLRRSVPSSLPHEVTITSSLLRHLCSPIELLRPGELHDHVAAKLGLSPSSLLTARLRGVFRTRHIPLLAGRRGKPVPLLYTDAPLDPTARLFAPPDPMWGRTAMCLTRHIPDNLHQTLQRIPQFRAPHPCWRYSDHPVHPELQAGDTAAARRASRRLPPPPPDYVWYKWSRDGRYLGDDPRAWRKSPSDPGGPTIFKPRKSKPPRHKPSTSQGSHHFRGWLWICPGCKHPVKKLYYPLGPLSLGIAVQRLRQNTPLWRTIRTMLDDTSSSAALPTFACCRCHRVRHISRIDRNAWNHLITYLSAGLLFGHEVPKPDDFSSPALRKHPYRPQSNRPAPRRQQVLRRLLNGWTIRQIARDLNIGIQAVHNQIFALCKQENVPNRHDLARKLSAPHTQPLNQDERAVQRRAEIQRLILEGKTYKQIMAELHTDFSAVNRDTQRLYRLHGVKGPGQQARRALAKKLGVIFKTDRDRRIEPEREQIRLRRAAGQPWRQIAKEMNLNFWTVDSHAKAIRREQRPAARHQLATNN